jgi:hypothetical protein
MDYTNYDEKPGLDLGLVSPQFIEGLRQKLEDIENVTRGWKLHYRAENPNGDKVEIIEPPHGIFLRYERKNKQGEVDTRLMQIQEGQHVVRPLYDTLKAVLPQERFQALNLGLLDPKEAKLQ